MGWANITEIETTNRNPGLKLRCFQSGELIVECCIAIASRDDEERPRINTGERIIKVCKTCSVDL